MLGVGDANDRPPIGRHLAGPPDLGLAGVTPVVRVGPDVELRKHLGRPADVVAVLVGDPQEVDGRRVKVSPELGEQVPIGRRAHVAATRAPRAVPGVDEDVATVREVDENGERLVDVVEVDDELAPAAAGRDRRGGARRR
jgi:hypothetical protein